jgi:exosome complex component RRP42
MSESLTILPGRKAWLLNLDAVVLSDGGNVYDVLFMSCRAALWSTRVPKTKAVEYHDSAQKRAAGQDDDVEMADIWKASVQTRKVARAADFELEDYWDHGAPLAGRALCPLAVTLNVVSLCHYM